MTYTAQLAAENATRAATRARILAGIIRVRVSLNGARDIDAAADLRAIAGHLVDAADAFDEDIPPVLDGMTITNSLPMDAVSALWEARETTENLRTGLFPACVLDYVTEPVTGRLPELAPLYPVSPALAAQDRKIRDDIASVTGFLGDWDGEELVRAALADLLDLHGKFARLAEAAAVDNAQHREPPVTYRTADGKRTAEHSKRRNVLTVFEGLDIIAELDVPSDVTPGQVWKLIADAKRV